MPSDRLELAKKLATDSGLRTFDLFLSGRVPILTEGIDDVAYVKAAWRCLNNGQDPEAAGVLVLDGQGISNIPERARGPPDTDLSVHRQCGRAVGPLWPEE